MRDGEAPDGPDAVFPGEKCALRQGRRGSWLNRGQTEFVELVAGEEGEKGLNVS